MSLFHASSQNRESLTIWEIFTYLPLYAELSDGEVYKWYAFNIPMRIVQGTRYNSDIDIVGCFSDRCGSGFSYKTWEVKVSLVDKEGKSHSLKAGKTKDVLKQLRAYRDFGSPSVTLLESYICEQGYFEKFRGLPDEIEKLVREKIPYFQNEGFGYQLLPFQQNMVGGKIAVSGMTLPGRFTPLLKIIKSVVRSSSDDFVKLTGKIWGFIMSNPNPSMAPVHKQLITYCSSCKSLCTIERKEAPVCPNCGKPILFQ